MLQLLTRIFSKLVKAKKSLWCFWRTLLNQLKSTIKLNLNQFYDYETNLNLCLLSPISECRFGDRRYSLEDTWNPDLGPPFGVMQCVHCECVPVSQTKVENKMFAPMICLHVHWKPDIRRPDIRIQWKAVTVTPSEIWISQEPWKVSQNGFGSP